MCTVHQTHKTEAWKCRTHLMGHFLDTVHGANQVQRLGIRRQPTVQAKDLSRTRQTDTEKEGMSPQGVGSNPRTKKQAPQQQATVQ